MSDTHINAFFMDVDDKKKAVELAKAELQAAEQRLEDKKHEIGFEEPEEEHKPHAVSRSAKDGKFVSKAKAEDEPDTTVTEKVEPKK